MFPGSRIGITGLLVIVFFVSTVSTGLGMKFNADYQRYHKLSENLGLKIEKQNEMEIKGNWK